MDEGKPRAEALRELARTLQVPIQDLELFDQALTHASLGGDVPGAVPHYESLEFLGDAVLGLAAAHRLFDLFPRLAPGDYTRLRAALVNRESVARAGERLGLADYILLGRGEEQAGGRKRRALLSDCTEAVIGAVYLDCGWEVARDFVIRVFGEEFDQVRDADFAIDYRSRLQEWCQAERRALPEYAVVRESGPDHDKRFVVRVSIEGIDCGDGEGKSKKQAQGAAAGKAYESIMSSGFPPGEALA
ncbi:MAG: ribonuclease III [Candidatus Hydrogenedens sp.]|nr:ribonuclease III [Candidatus Hydrogenedens sp.]